MTARDADAVERLATALVPVVQRVDRARQAVRRGRAVAVAVGSVPRLAGVALLATVAVAWLVAVPAWLPALAVLAAAAGTFLIASRRCGQRPVHVGDGALAADRGNHNQDRLTAAFEFAAGAPAARGEVQAEALVHAAIEDGVQSLARIDAARLELPASVSRPAWRTAAVWLLALAVLPWLLPAPAAPTAGRPTAVGDGGEANRTGPLPRVEPRAERTAGAPAAPVGREDTRAQKDTANRAGAPPPPRPAEPAPAVAAASGQGQSGNDAAGDSSQNGAPKAAPTGNPGSGQSGGGQGSAASGAPEPTPATPTPKAPGKPRPQAPKKDPPQQDGKPGESAGAPSGPSRGSGRLSSVGNKRSDLNRGQERQDDPEVADEEVDEETEDQEQRGGVVPMRRGDNRPPARELSISGDGPPDQGRGGPTPPKKARGTASLVLGLRLPDSVRGQPNPGTAKTSLEQIPPRPGAEAAGLARAVPAGMPTTPQRARPPGPFLTLQQTYHALLRARDVAGASAAAPATIPEPPPKDPR